MNNKWSELFNCKPTRPRRHRLTGSVKQKESGTGNFRVSVRSENVQKCAIITIPIPGKKTRGVRRFNYSFVSVRGSVGSAEESKKKKKPYRSVNSFFARVSTAKPPYRSDRRNKQSISGRSMFGARRRVVSAPQTFRFFFVQAIAEFGRTLVWSGG